MCRSSPTPRAPPPPKPRPRADSTLPREISSRSSHSPRTLRVLRDLRARWRRFHRGGEEAQALIDADIPFDVVPGISSAVGVPAYAGIPVTHRGLSASFTVVTGHREKGGSSGVNWEALAAVGGTIVVLMGVAERGAIAERLIAGGLNYNTPVAATRWGTRAAQETVRTTLGELGTTPLEAPCTIVIGAVAALNFSWRSETHTPELI